MFDWPPSRIREVFDAHPDMTIPRLARMTGLGVNRIREILFHADKLTDVPRGVVITNRHRAAQTT